MFTSFNWMLRGMARDLSERGLPHDDVSVRREVIELVRSVWGDQAASQTAEKIGCDELGRTITYLTVNKAQSMEKRP